MSDPADLLDLARRARANAWAPYSHYQVGAVIRGVSGRLYAGCNVENAAYPEGTCAEAGAIAAMVLAGEKAIAEVLVMGDHGAACTPCGGCRQKLREFAGPDVIVHVSNPDGVVLRLTVAELLPSAFGPANLPE